MVSPNYSYRPPEVNFLDISSPKEEEFLSSILNLGTTVQSLSERTVSNSDEFILKESIIQVNKEKEILLAKRVRQTEISSFAQAIELLNEVFGSPGDVKTDAQNKLILAKLLCDDFTQNYSIAILLYTHIIENTKSSTFGISREDYELILKAKFNLACLYTKTNSVSVSQACSDFLDVKLNSSDSEDVSLAKFHIAEITRKGSGFEKNCGLSSQMYRELIQEFSSEDTWKMQFHLAKMLKQGGNGLKENERESIQLFKEVIQNPKTSPIVIVKAKLELASIFSRNKATFSTAISHLLEINSLGVNNNLQQDKIFQILKRKALLLYDKIIILNSVLNFQGSDLSLRIIDSLLLKNPLDFKLYWYKSQILKNLSLDYLTCLYKVYILGDAVLKNLIALKHDFSRQKKINFDEYFQHIEHYHQAIEELRTEKLMGFQPLKNFCEWWPSHFGDFSEFIKIFSGVRPEHDEVMKRIIKYLVHKDFIYHFVQSKLHNHETVEGLIPIINFCYAEAQQIVPFVPSPKEFFQSALKKDSNSRKIATKLLMQVDESSSHYFKSMYQLILLGYVEIVNNYERGPLLYENIKTLTAKIK